MEDNKSTDEVGSGQEHFHDAVECMNGDSNNVDKQNSEADGEANNGDGQNLDVGDALGRFSAFRGGELHARMPVAKYATHYKMNHRKRGLAYIFNHEVFQCGGLKSRSGTNEDCKNLKECLTSLGFEVHGFKDLTYQDIETRIREVSKVDHSDHDCLLIAVLSHGEMGIVYAKDMPYKPDYLWTPFTADKCPTLAGKPKIFFLQACQGDKLDGGVNLSTTETDGEIYNTYRIPVQADFLIVYSTVKDFLNDQINLCEPNQSMPCYYSWRNTTKGSWFIQSLCDELKKRAQENDLMTILTFVSQRVAVDFESNVPDNHSMHRQKQIPCIMSMLTRLIHFNPAVGN